MLILTAQDGMLEMRAAELADMGLLARHRGSTAPTNIKKIDLIVLSTSIHQISSRQQYSQENQSDKAGTMAGPAIATTFNIKTF